MQLKDGRGRRPVRGRGEHEVSVELELLTAQLAVLDLKAAGGRVEHGHGARRGRQAARAKRLESSLSARIQRERFVDAGHELNERSARRHGAGRDERFGATHLRHEVQPALVAHVARRHVCCPRRRTVVVAGSGGGDHERRQRLVDRARQLVLRVAHAHASELVQVPRHVPVALDHAHNGTLDVCANCVVRIARVVSCRGLSHLQLEEKVEQLKLKRTTKTTTTTTTKRNEKQIRG